MEIDIALWVNGNSEITSYKLSCQLRASMLKNLLCELLDLLGLSLSNYMPFTPYFRRILSLPIGSASGSCYGKQFQRVALLLEVIFLARLRHREHNSSSVRFPSHKFFNEKVILPWLTLTTNLGLDSLRTHYSCSIAHQNQARVSRTI